MFDWILPRKHAIAILKKECDLVKKVFESSERAEIGGD